MNVPIHQAGPHVCPHELQCLWPPSQEEEGEGLTSVFQTDRLPALATPNSASVLLTFVLAQDLSTFPNGLN